MMTRKEFQRRYPAAYAAMCDPAQFNFTMPGDYPDCGYVTQEEVLENEFNFAVCPTGEPMASDADRTWWGYWDGSEWVDG